VVIRIRISKKNRQHNGQKKKDKRTNNDLQNTHKTRDLVTRTPLKTGGALVCSGRIGSSWSTSGTRLVNLVTNPVISHEWGKDREVFTTSGTYPWSFVTQIFHSGQRSHGGDRKTFDDFKSYHAQSSLVLPNRKQLEPVCYITIGWNPFRQYTEMFECSQTQ
jgi:hypothetical protein